MRGVRHPGEGLHDDPAPRSAVRESGLEFRWHKRRWWCREPGCPRRSCTEQIPQLPAGARITLRLRGAAGRRIRDAASTVIQAARDVYLSWPTVMDPFRTAAHEVTQAPLPEVKVLGIDETRRGRPRWEQAPRRQVDADARSVAHGVRRRSGADAPVTRSGKRGDACRATEDLTTSSSPQCGTHCWRPTPEHALPRPARYGTGWCAVVAVCRETQAPDPTVAEQVAGAT
ncbi:helix-turn-helix domain-containing protein [Streptomyces wuyuanensis]|uniref:helix-turn-helix domain-containing protein n=1 Tax=Streptomyces wuyuanensis TaxID=1196353 RepID=UPI003809998B